MLKSLMKQLRKSFFRWRLPRILHGFFALESYYYYRYFFLYEWNDGWIDGKSIIWLSLAERQEKSWSPHKSKLVRATVSRSKYFTMIFIEWFYILFCFRWFPCSWSAVLPLLKGMFEKLVIFKLIWQQRMRIETWRNATKVRLPYWKPIELFEIFLNLKH